MKYTHRSTEVPVIVYYIIKLLLIDTQYIIIILYLCGFLERLVFFFLSLYFFGVRSHVIMRFEQNVVQVF